MTSRQQLDAPGSTTAPPQGGIGELVMRWMPLIIGIALAALLQFVVRQRIGLYQSLILMNIGISIMLAVSLNIVNGLTGQFSIGHAGFMAVGGYASAFITYYGSMLIWGNALKHPAFLGAGEWLFMGSCLVGGLVAAGLGYVVGLPSLRLRGDYLAIVTLGFGEIVRVVLQQTNHTIDSIEAIHESTWRNWVPPPVGGSLGFDGVPKYTNLFWVYLFVAVTVVFAYRLKQSSIGRAMLAVREDEIAAQSIGVNIARNKVLAFVFAAFFAGMAGGLLSHLTGVVIGPTEAGFQRSFDYVIMTVLGGRGSISGVIVSATILTILPEALRDLMEYRLIIYAMLLIIMMLVRPQGLFGIHEIWDFFPGSKQKPSLPTPSAGEAA